MFGQDAAPKLIISEIYMYHTEEAYLEITNMDNYPVDLSRVILSAAQNGQSFRDDTVNQNTQMLHNVGFLDPGESFVIINYRTHSQDSTRIFTPSWYPGNADYMLYYTLRGGSSGLRFANGDDAFGLFWDKDGDSDVDFAVDTLLDLIGKYREEVTFDVAGVTNASVTHTFIRKANVTEGNAGSWITSAGVSAEDSEWIVVPYNPFRLGAMFTTIGIHGNSYEWDITPVSGTIDENGLSIPWGTWRDSVYRAFNMGPNTAWHLIWGADTLQSNAVQTNDTILFYLCGDEVEIRKYPITVTEALEDNNKVIPRLNLSYTGTPFRVTDGVPVIDTIYSIPFGTRIDTMYAYLEKASNATWDYQTFDGSIRADVQTGDKLIVTASNGDEKEYYIRTDEYSPNDNAYLSTILIDQDTLWGFSPSTNRYSITLPEDANSFPSISATTQNNDATAVIKHPTFIRGSVEDRTAVITVTAESDTVTFKYYITFGFPKAIQENRMDIFFSQIVCANTRWDRGLELFNPSNVPISLADYMVVRARPGGGADISNLEEAVNYNSSGEAGFRLFFGKVWDESRSEQGVYFTETSKYFIDMDPFATFFIKRGFTDDWGGADFYAVKDEWEELYGFVDGRRVYLDGQNCYWILKVENDSVLNGLKSANDPDDWRFIDIWGAVGDVFDHTIPIDGRTAEWKIDRHYIRKPQINKGNIESFGSLREDDGPGSSEWNIVEGDDYDGPLSDVRRHANFIKPTYFKSTIESSTYLVSPGISDAESIDGVFPGESVTSFYSKLVKAHRDQLLMVKAADGSGQRGETDAIQSGDTLVAVSADATNTTKYLILTGFLSTNALLTSSVYNIKVSGTNGTIDSIAHFTTIEEMLEDLTIPNGAFLNIFDSNRNHIAIQHYAPDTLIELKPMVTENVFLEVIAEDGVTKILYSIIMETGHDPYLTSPVYLIDQEDKIIDLFVDNTNIMTFMDNVEPSKGAEINVFDKFDYRRTIGNMFIDDKVVVTDEQDNSVIYTLKSFSDTITAVTDTTDTTDTTGISRDMLSQYSVYPNPAGERLFIKGLEPGSKIVVINTLGEMIEIREAWSNIAEIDLSEYRQGIYFLRIMHGKSAFTQKFLKE